VIGNQVARTKCYSPPPQASYHRSAQARPPVQPAARGYDGNYAASRGCTYETQRYYDERGQVVYTPTKVCR